MRNLLILTIGLIALALTMLWNPQEKAAPATTPLYLEDRPARPIPHISRHK